MSASGQEFPARFGKYLLIERLAVGGMAEVLLALEQTPQAGRRFVVIKRIRQEHAHDADYIDFFLTEGRVALKCCHPNLPQTYELSTEADANYLSMELIRGHTLLDIVNAAAVRAQKISVRSALAVGIGVAAALEHVHALCDVDGAHMRVVHRDVTPQNIMVTTAGVVKLIDFGIVRSTVQSHRTRTGVVKGKFSYLAPEVLERGRTIDQRADVFALGIVLHETLAARSLFRGKNERATLENLKAAQAPDIASIRPDIPPELADVIHIALAGNPDQRFQTATEFLQALDGVAESCGVHVSMTRLREEVATVCGAPAQPTVSRDVVSALRRAMEQKQIPGGADSSGGKRDERLAYFLDKSTSSSTSPGADLPTEDPDFAELLTLLET